MQRLSSRSTYFHTRVFPVIWFGALVAGAVFLIVESFVWKQPGLFVAAALPALFVGFGVYLFRSYVFDLADEAWLDDHSIYVVRRGQRATIDLADVDAVETRLFRNPPRMTLVLREPCPPFGDCVSFIPEGAIYVPVLQRHPIARVLDRQVSAASARQPG